MIHPISFYYNWLDLANKEEEKMKREILEVVNKYVNGVQIDDVNINHRSEDSLDVLEMNINLPEHKK